MSGATVFEHRHAAHCESGAMSNLLRHYGATVSEPMAFGLASALSFAWLPFIKLGGMPLVAYRMPPGAIVKGLQKPFDARFRFETFRSQEAGQRRLDELLAEGRVVGLQTSVFWLPYFPEEMRFHFNAHNLLVYGREGDQYLISDPVAENPVRCAAADLARARFARGVLAPKGLLYYPERVGRTAPTPQSVRKAILRTTRLMTAPVPLVGVAGMRRLASRLARLDPQDDSDRQLIGFVVRMQEEIGTGGAGFRFLYAAFLQEAAKVMALPALEEMAEELMSIGDGWRSFALSAARMLRGREAMNPPALAALVTAQAAAEERFFRTLRRVVA